MVIYTQSNKCRESTFDSRLVLDKIPGHAEAGPKLCSHG